VIDALVFHDWSTSSALTPYLDEGYREWIERPGDSGGALQLKAQWLYHHPFGERSSAERALDYETLKADLLDGGSRERVVLGYYDGILATSYPSRYAASKIVRAANEWTVEHWLERDSRLYGLILISSAMPEAAAAEIRRAGADDRMVGVALGANALGPLFGDPVYHPIYRAAAELGLPLVLQVGADATTDTEVPPVAGGLPATYAEYAVLGAHSLMSHVGSMIVESVFDLFPSLKIMLVGGGVAWVPAYVWRLDYWYKMSPSEAPWIRGLPSRYFAEHFRVSTYSLESPDEPERLASALATVPELEQMLVYGSGHPLGDAEEPVAVAPRIPASWHDAVFSGNAEDLFRWPGRPSPEGRGLDASALAERPHADRHPLLPHE
jgi:uncharacterized protein